MDRPGGIVKSIIKTVGLAAPLFDVLFLPFTFFAGAWFRIVRFWGPDKMPLTRSAFLKLGVFPVVDHYYDPLFDHRKIAPRKAKSHLDFRDEQQLGFLRQLTFNDELNDTPVKKGTDLAFHYNNGSFESGDAELYYSIIRKIRPSRIIEVGSGFSTLIALKAVAKNKAEDPAYSCKMTCIEPYEMPYLEKLDITLLRSKVEDVSLEVFSQLGRNDILFIDSSHIIRSGGDVTHEILSILPMLPSGVWIHFHDIFLPDDYPKEWLEFHFRMWNEQYLLEAFLLGNPDFEIVCSLYYLCARFRPEVAKTFPRLAEADRMPGSFWIVKK